MQIKDKNGSPQEVKIGLDIYQRAESEKCSVPQLINRLYETDKEAYGSAFDQVCATSGLIMATDHEIGLKPPSLADVMSGRSMFGSFDAAVVSDADPASRILYPAAVIALIEDQLAVDRTTDAFMFDKMVGEDISVNSPRYEQPVISYSKVTQRAKAISQLAEPARLLSITTTDVARTIPTVAIGMEISDQALQASTLDQVSLVLRRYSELERRARAYEYLMAFLNGDSDHGQSALSQTKADTYDSAIVAAGAVTKKALLKWAWHNYHKRTLSHIVTDVDGAIALEAALTTTNTGNYPIPGMVPNFSLMNRMLQSLEVFVVDSDVVSWPANTLMGLDSRYAITRVTNTSAAYSAVEQFVLRRASVLRLDLGEVAYRKFDDAFDTLSLTLTTP